MSFFYKKTDHSQVAKESKTTIFSQHHKSLPKRVTHVQASHKRVARLGASHKKSYMWEQFTKRVSHIGARIKSHMCEQVTKELHVWEQVTKESYMWEKVTKRVSHALQKIIRI